MIRVVATVAWFTGDVLAAVAPLLGKMFEGFARGMDELMRGAERLIGDILRIIGWAALLIGLPLGLIYIAVRFIKWAWAN